MEQLKDKIVLVVGATGGIGKATCKLLSQSGAKVYAAGRRVEELSSLNLPFSQQLQLDITSEASVYHAIQQIIQTDGKIDILINAAGIGIIKPLEMLSLDDFTASLQTNLIGSFLLMKAVIPHMKIEKKGLIINIPGVLGKTPMMGAAAYTASKYGLVGMMQSIREELKRTEIRITNLFIGGVNSPFWDNIDLRVQKEKMISIDEAARAIWFLCQQPSSGVVSEMVLQPFNHQAI